MNNYNSEKQKTVEYKDDIKQSLKNVIVAKKIVSLYKTPKGHRSVYISQLLCLLYIELFQIKLKFNSPLFIPQFAGSLGNTWIFKVREFIKKDIC